MVSTSKSVEPIHSKLLIVINIAIYCLLVLPLKSEAQSPEADPFLEQLTRDCSQSSLLGVKSLMMLKDSYPNHHHNKCFNSISSPAKFTPIGSIGSVHSWLLFKIALESRNLSQAYQLKKRFKPLSNPLIVSSKSRVQHHELSFNPERDLGLYCSAMFQDPSQYSFVWSKSPHKKAQNLSISYRGQVTIGIAGQQFRLEPSQHFWIDDTIIPIKAHSKTIKISVKPAKNSCFMLRLDRQSKNLNLWEKLQQQLDKRPQTLSEDALLVLALIAQESQVEESKRLLPIIEADQRWNRKPSLWLSQAFQSLSPPEIRAQAWGDYPPMLALKSELKRLTSEKKRFTKLTQFQLLSLREFHDHLDNGRVNKARKLLESLIEQDSLQHLSWMSYHMIIAQNTLDRYLGLNQRPLHRLTKLGSLDDLLKAPLLGLEYIQALTHLSTSEKVSFLCSSKFASWLKLQLEKVEHLNPYLVQILTEFLVHSKANEGLWLQGLLRVSQGPAGLELLRQLQSIFTSDIQVLKRKLIDRALYTSSGLVLGSTPKLKNSITKHLTALASPSLSTTTPSLKLGGDMPWLQTALEREHLEALHRKNINLETVYQHTHYELHNGRLRKTERRVLKPLNKHAARSLIKISLPHSPSRQSFVLDHLRHLQNLQGLYQSRPNVKRSQRSLSNPEERLYYDLIAEDLHFENLRAGDLVDIQWSITELNPDPSFSLPHADLVILQDRSYKRCLLVTIDEQLLGKLKSDLVLKHLKNKQDFQQYNTHCSQAKSYGSPVVLLSQVPPLIPEESSLQGTSIYPYLHLSNLRNWSTIVTLYKAMLDPIIKPTDLLIQQAKTWTKDVKVWDKSILDRKRYESEILESLFLKITQNTRYVGLEFGRHSYEPALPDVTIERGLGDCKDRAALMIALARTLGIRLDFAMIRTRSAGKLNANGLVSLSSFDHAAVYSPTLKRYFDPTLAHYDPNVLPQADHGAQALLINTQDRLSSINNMNSNHTLTTIPPPIFNTIGELIKLKKQLSPSGKQEILIEVALFGESAVKIREWYENNEINKLNAQLDQLFPHLELKQEQIKITKTSVGDRDPILIQMSSSVKVSKQRPILPIKFVFDVTRAASFSHSQRKQTLYVPQSRHVRCIERSEADQKFEQKLINKLKAMDKAPILGWSITSTQDSKSICFQVLLKSTEVLATDYKTVYHWLHDTETQLNQGLRLLTEKYFIESEAHD